MDKIRRTLFIHNPWWFGERIITPSPKRDIYQDLVKSIPDKRATQLIGLRRVGKTTLFLQTINYLLDKKINPKNILYLSVDAVELKNVENPIKELFLQYLDEVFPEGKIYLFLDEVHFSPNWALEVKNIYDQHSPKIFLTGSSSTKILRSAKEELTGRVKTFYLSTLSISEFAKLSGKEFTKNLELHQFLTSPLKYFQKIKSKPLEYENLRRKILPIFNQYLMKGGLPEGVFEKDIQKYFSNVREDLIERVLYKDIPEIFGIKDRALLYDLFIYLIYNSGSLISFNSLSQNFKAKINTISNYIFYLTASNLIMILPKYARSIEGILKTQKKIYPTDVIIRNVIIGKRDVINGDDSIIGKTMENLVISSCYNLTKRDSDIGIYYWRNKYEVDLIFKEANKIAIPIEVKYRKDIKDRDLQGIINFLSRENLKFGIIITRDILELRKINNKNLILIPAWFFIAMC